MPKKSITTYETTYYLQGERIDPRQLYYTDSRGLSVGLAKLDDEQLFHCSYSTQKEIAHGNYGWVYRVIRSSRELAEYYPYTEIAIKAGRFNPKDETPEKEARYFSLAHDSLTIVVTQSTSTEDDINCAAAAGGKSSDQATASSTPAAGKSGDQAAASSNAASNHDDKAKSVKSTAKHFYRMYMTAFPDYTLHRAILWADSSKRASPMTKLNYKLLLLLIVTKRLHDLHQKGCIHGDMKPTNITLTRKKDFIKDMNIIDFGLSYKVKDTHATHFPNDETDHISSDRRKKDAPAPDVRQDLYSLILSYYKYYLTKDEKPNCQFLQQILAIYELHFSNKPLEKDQKTINNCGELFLVIINELSKIIGNMPEVYRFIDTFTTRPLSDELKQFHQTLLTSTATADAAATGAASGGSYAADDAAATGAASGGGCAAADAGSSASSDHLAATTHTTDLATDPADPANGAVMAAASQVKSWCTMFTDLAQLSKENPRECIGRPGRSFRA